MTLESILAFLHLSAILAVVVFSTSEAALCRAEWLNAAVVERLVKVDRIYLVALLAVLLTGLARIVWGIKGDAWYWSNWLLHLKFALFVVIAAMAVRPARRFRAWRAQLGADGSLPAPEDIARVRRQVFAAAHLVALVPLAAVFLARGFGG